MNVNELMRSLAEYMRIADEAAAIIDGLKDQLKQAMQAAGTDTIIGAEHKASYKTVISSRIDTAALKKALPEVAKEYTRTTETKRFTFA